MNLLNYVYVKEGQVVGSQVSFLENGQTDISNIIDDSERFRSMYKADEIRAFTFDYPTGQYIPIDLQTGIVGFPKK